MSERKFGCPECGREYQFNKNLRRHVSKAHPEKVNTIAPRQRSARSTLPYVYNCDNCNKVFNTGRNLQRHQRDSHGQRKYSPKCSLCDFEATTEDSLYEHLELTHDRCVNSEELEFSSFDDFKSWKEETEAATLSCFVKIRGSHTGTNNAITRYYACHRSGNFVSRSKGVRHLKLQGSNKIGTVCPAKIRVTEDEQGVCKVKFVSTHIGHQHEFAHLGLTEKERNSIAADIANKIPYQAILDKIRDSVSACNLERVDLLTRQDLYNIKRCHNLCSASVRHQNDGTSVEAWVNEMKANDNTCVLFYKPQDTASETHPELRSRDFVLIIMNSAQSEILEKYGNDCICIDRTHRMNSYGFELMTLLVLDDDRQGFPCAFLISNRNDCQVLSIFFHCIRSEVGKLSPKVFMSDLEESSFDAWISTMEIPKMRLYCTWLVDEAWRKNIKNKIRNQEKQTNTYKLLRQLLEETDVDEFETNLHVVLSILSSDPDLYEFASYFDQYYMSNVNCWAYCYRLHAGLDTNMHIERMHHTLKYIYLHGKQVKHLDKTICALMSCVKDKLFDRLILHTKDKLARKMKDILRRHKSSLQIDKQLIIKEDKEWKILSAWKMTDLYFVKDNEIECTCKLICSECNTCIHRYSCTCVDSSIKWNMCKHIHSVCQIQLGHELPLKPPQKSSELVIQYEDVSTVNEKIQCEDVSTVDQKIQCEDVSTVNEKIQCEDVSTVNEKKQCEDVSTVNEKIQCEDVSTVNQKIQCEDVSTVNEKIQCEDVSTVNEKIQCEDVSTVNERIQCEDVSTVNENQQIMEQVSNEDDNQAFSSLSQQKDKKSAEILDLIREISTNEELDVLNKYTAELKATLAAVRNRHVLMPKTADASKKRKVDVQRRSYSTKKKRTSHSTESQNKEQ